MEAEVQKPKTAREIAEELYNGGMGCNCDLDRWQPERDTGHSHVCRIHKATIQRIYYPVK